VTTIAAVPVKDFADAKQRLGSLLTPVERAALARTMLEDVLAALCASPVDVVYVVTRDPEVTERVRDFRVEIVEEPANRGHSEAVALAQAAASARWADLFLTVPGDVPDVTAGEVRAMLDSAKAGRAAVFVPSLSGYGTNGTVLRPPHLLTLTFGEPSFANHLAAARALHLAPAVLRLPGLGLDIDTPDDLRALLDRGSPTRSSRLLEAWGLRGRLPASGEGVEKSTGHDARWGVSGKSSGRSPRR